MLMPAAVCGSVATTVAITDGAVTIAIANAAVVVVVAAVSYVCDMPRASFNPPTSPQVAACRFLGYCSSVKCYTMSLRNM